MAHVMNYLGDMSGHLGSYRSCLMLNGVTSLQMAQGGTPVANDYRGGRLPSD